MPIPAEKKEKWKQQAIESQKLAHNMIHEIGKSYADRPEQLAEILEFGSKFYKYSISNMELIYAQNKGAMYVQSFEAWKEMDTSVLKGQKGIKIFVPVQSTVLILEDNSLLPLQDASAQQKEMYKKGLIESKKVLRYKIGNVFDISQTNFPVERYPELFSVGYASEQHAEIAEGLVAFCKQIGVTVDYKDLNSISIRGYFAPDANRIVVNELLNDTQKLSTLSHELGHALEEHGTKDISSAQKEFEADSISILIQSHFGLELSDTRKSHLADHYRKFEAEIKEQYPEISEEELHKKVDTALAASLKVFRSNIEKIVECVAKNGTQEKVKENIPKQKSYSYEVAECSEFPSMGEIYTGIATPEDAIKMFLKIPEHKQSLIPGINLIIGEGDDKIGVPLSAGKIIDFSMFEFYPEIKENAAAAEHIQKFIKAARENGFQTYGTLNLGANSQGETPVNRHRRGR